MTDQAATVTQSASTTTETTQSSAPVATLASPTVVQEPTAFSNQLGDEYKQVKSFQNLKDVNDLAKMALHAQQLIGKKVQDWEAGDIRSVYKKLGAPDTEDGYLLPTEVNADDAKVFKSIAHKAGLSVEQAKAFIGEAIAREREQKLSYDSKLKSIKDDWTKETQEMWGDPATVEKRNYVADRAIKDLGGEKLSKLLEETGIKDHPAVKKLFADIGTKYLYEHEVIGIDKAGAFGQTTQQKSELASQLRNDPAYFNARDPRHRAVVAEVKKLEGISW